MNFAALAPLVLRPVLAFALSAMMLGAIIVANRAALSPPPQWGDEWTNVEYDLGRQLADDEDAAVAVAPLALDTAAESIAPPWLEYRIRRGDRMDKILRTMGASADSRAAILAQKARSYRLLRVGETIQFRLGEDNSLSRLRYKTTPEYYLSVARVDGEWRVEEKAPKLVTAVVRRGGQIDSSLFAAADRAGIPDAAIERLIDALEWQVDFYREVRKGDSFKFIYEAVSDEDGELVKVALLPAYEYVSHLGGKRRVIRGVWHRQKRGFYSPQGESMQRAFLRAPLKYKRISSRFTHRRYHPVLKKWRAHRGVDYAARTGTPVRATADGTVSTVERQRGYGKVVMLKHFQKYKTVYGHLSRFARGLRRGKKVRQGEIIGYVGQTGLATGPHLHYEFRIHNKHKNPLSASIPRRLPALNKAELAAFRDIVARYEKQLDELDAVAVQ